MARTKAEIRQVVNDKFEVESRLEELQLLEDIKDLLQQLLAKP